MKKLLVLLTAFVMFTGTITVFAGSVPEDLLHTDYAQVFFAKLVFCRQSADGRTEANLVPTKVIKGDVNIGESLWYDDALECGDFNVVTGEEYLFCYFDENNPTYFFKTTSQDTRGLKFLNTTGDMWDRLEQYLNDGEFEKAEQKRIEDAKSRTIIQLLETEKVLIEEVRFTCRKGADGKQIEVDRDVFLDLLGGISAAQISDTVNTETDGFFIRMTDANNRTRELFISESGLVSKNNPQSSMVDSAEYKISNEDLKKLYNLANIKMPSKYIAVLPWVMISAVGIFIFVWYRRRQKS